MGGKNFTPPATLERLDESSWAEGDFRNKPGCWKQHFWKKLILMKSVKRKPVFFFPLQPKSHWFVFYSCRFVWFVVNKIFRMYSRSLAVKKIPFWHFEIRNDPFPSVIMCFANYFLRCSKPCSSVLRFPCSVVKKNTAPSLVYFVVKENMGTGSINCWQKRWRFLF